MEPVEFIAIVDYYFSTECRMIIAAICFILEIVYLRLQYKSEGRTSSWITIAILGLWACIPICNIFAFTFIAIQLLHTNKYVHGLFKIAAQPAFSKDKQNN